MRCRLIRTWLAEFATDGVDPARAAEFHAHLAACPRCAAEWQAVADVTPLLATVARAPVDDAVLERIRRGVQDALDNEPAPAARRPWFSWAAAGALTCLCAGFVIVSLGHRAADAPVAPPVTVAAAPSAPVLAPAAPAAKRSVAEVAAPPAPAARATIPPAQPAPAVAAPLRARRTAPATVTRPVSRPARATGGASPAVRLASARREPAPPAVGEHVPAATRPVATASSDGAVVVALAGPVVRSRTSSAFALRAPEPGELETGRPAAADEADRAVGTTMAKSTGGGRAAPADKRSREAAAEVATSLRLEPAVIVGERVPATRVAETTAR